MKPVLIARTTSSNSIWTKIVYPDYIIRNIQSLCTISLCHNTVLCDSMNQFRDVIVTAVNSVKTFIGTDRGLLVNSHTREVLLKNTLVHHLARACYDKCIGAGSNWTIVDDSSLDELLWRLFGAINNELFF